MATCWVKTMKTRVVLLGTGTPIPDPRRSGPSVAILVGTDVYLIDFGPGVVRQAVDAGLRPEDLTHAFLTHLHSDHTAGYPDLILTPGVEGRREPLEVYGPTGLQSMTDHILAAYKEDLRERLEGLEPASPEGYIVNVHEIPDAHSGVIFQNELIKVEAFPVEHGRWSSFGYKFTTSDRTIVISGDTAPTRTIIEKAQDCDILIHEVYSAIALEKRPTDWKRYHSSVHTSTYDLAKIATQARPKLLVLYHQLSWTRTDDELLAEVKENYDGKVVSGCDLDVF